jgi:hypothetical protein
MAIAIVLAGGVGGTGWQSVRANAELRTAQHGATEDVLSGVDLPTQEGEQIWIDREALKFLLGALEQYDEGKFAPILDHVQGLRLTRRGEFLDAALYFDEPFDLSLQEKSEAPRWQPYRVEVPKTLRFSLRIVDGVIVLSGLDRERNAIRLQLKMPFLPDRVWVRSVLLNLDNGHATVDAGVMGNHLTVVARAQLLARKFEGVDVWETFKRNLGLLEAPALVFKLN